MTSRDRPHAADIVDDLVALAADLHAVRDEAATARTIVDRVVALVPGVDLASLTLRAGRGSFRTVATSDELAQRVDDLQYAMHDGPCLQVAEHPTHGWIRSGHVRADQRWPRWAPRAADLGIASLLSLPMARERELHASLNLYGHATGRFVDREVVELATAVASLATDALSAARTTTGLRTALESRHLIGIAQGMVMERYAVDQERSFELLRRLSSTQNVKLRDLAAEITRSGQLPRVSLDPGGTDAPPAPRAPGRAVRPRDRRRGPPPGPDAPPG